jgi:hypothetical protein
VSGQGMLEERTEHDHGADVKIRIFDRCACVNGTSNTGRGGTRCSAAGARLEKRPHDASGRRGRVSRHVGGAHDGMSGALR